MIENMAIEDHQYKGGDDLQWWVFEPESHHSSQ
jgi:hypothetical protein